MSILDTALHIPAERGILGGRTRHLERVLLPLAARPAARFHIAVAATAAIALACLAMAGDLAFSAAGGANLALAPIFLLAALPPAGVALTGWIDARAPRPVLVIDRDGLLDTRLGPTPVAWERVVAAEIVATPSGIAAVRLTLDGDGAALFNPCRIGGWSAEWGRRRRVRTIALLLLSARPHTLAHTILVLAARNGATVAPASTTRPMV